MNRIVRCVCAVQVMRTSKFLCAMSVVPNFVSSNWVEASFKAKRWLPEKDFKIPVSYVVVDVVALVGRRCGRGRGVGDDSRALNTASVCCNR